MRLGISALVTIANYRNESVQCLISTFTHSSAPSFCLLVLNVVQVRKRCLSVGEMWT